MSFSIYGIEYNSVFPCFNLGKETRKKLPCEHELQKHYSIIKIV